MRDIHVTLTDEDIEAALVAYVSQKYGKIHDAQAIVIMSRAGSRGGLSVCATVNGFVRDDLDYASTLA